MFSRIFRIRILKKNFTNISQLKKEINFLLVKNGIFFSQCFLSFGKIKTNILKHLVGKFGNSYSEKFVKTCCELDLFWALSQSSRWFGPYSWWLLLFIWQIIFSPTRNWLANFQILHLKISSGFVLLFKKCVRGITNNYLMVF